MIASFVVSSLHLFIHISMYFSCFPIEYRGPKLRIRPFSAFSVPIFVSLILLLPAVTFHFHIAFSSFSSCHYFLPLRIAFAVFSPRWSPLLLVLLLMLLLPLLLLLLLLLTAGMFLRPPCALRRAAWGNTPWGVASSDATLL